MSDFRALCTELHAAFTTYAVDECHHNLLERARAALAKPEPEGPTVMQIIELSDEIEAVGLGQVDFARAVLARWGNPAPQPPADGKVAKLVEWLRMQGEAQKPGLNSLLCKKTKKELQTNGERLIRAADLLQQQVPVPVSVSERLPGPEDCDGEGKCWWFHDEDNASCSHWLPAHALPLPTAND